MTNIRRRNGKGDTLKTFLLTVVTVTCAFAQARASNPAAGGGSKANTLPTFTSTTVPACTVDQIAWRTDVTPRAICGCTAVNGWTYITGASAGTSCGNYFPPSAEIIIQMRAQAIKHTPMAAAEVSETPISAWITTTATKGVTTHLTHDGASTTFPVGMLVVFYGPDFEYYTGKVAASGPGWVDLAAPIETNVTDHRVNGGQGQMISFWENNMHPWATGYHAIADYARRQLVAAGYDGSSGKPNVTQGVHVMLGDSWFANDYIANFLRGQWPGATIFNAGVNANKGDQMVARFATDVTPRAPNFVWVMDGSNDAANGYTSATYMTNMNALVALIKGIGATPVIITPAEGWLGDGSIALLDQYETDLLAHFQ